MSNFWCLCYYHLDWSNLIVLSLVLTNFSEQIIEYLRGIHMFVEIVDDIICINGEDKGNSK